MDALRRTVLDALTEIAPEVDAADVDATTPLQEQFDLDSMDFLAFLGLLAERTGVEVAERDYAEIATLDGCVAYLSARGGTPAG